MQTMAKNLRGSTKASPPLKKTSKKLSLYPLDLETALGAALRVAPKEPLKKQKKTKSS
jgi:hypothetical protein